MARETSSRSSTTRACSFAFRSIDRMPRSHRGGVELLLAHHGRPDEDRRQRRAELVREHGQELVLGAVRGGQLVGERGEVTTLARERALEHVARTLDGRQVRDARAQLFGHDGLRQEVLHALAEQPYAQLVVGLRGQHDDGDRVQLGPCAERAHERVAAHDRHHHVAQDDVGLELERPLQALLAVERRRDAVVRGETVDQEAAHLGVVLDHEHEPAAVRTAGLDRELARRPELGDGLPCDLVERGAAVRRRRGLHVGARDGQVHAEARAALGRVVDGDVSAVALDDVLGDGEPEPRPAEPPGRRVVAAAEPLEDRLAQVDGHAGTRVLDREDDVRAVDADAHAYAPAVGDELQGVREQVQQHALELRAIRDDRERIRSVDRQRDVPLARHDVEQRDRAAYQLDQVHA